MISGAIWMRLIQKTSKSEMDLNAVRVLLAVVDAGSFSAAARKLAVPANRLSRRIQQLEADLGVRLLQRTTRRLGLTTTGQAMVDGAGPAMAQLERLWQEASTQANEPRGHLRVAAPSNVFSLLPAERIADFLARYPAISLEMLSSDDHADLIGSGVDLALRAGSVHGEDLIARQIAIVRLVIVASPACLVEHGTPQTLSELSDYPCLGSRGKDGRARWALTGPEGECSVEVRARLIVNGMSAVVTAAKAGLGAALVPHRLAREALANGALVHVMTDYFLEGGVFIVYPSRRHPTAAMRAFRDFIIEESSLAAAAEPDFIRPAP